VLKSVLAVTALALLAGCASKVPEVKPYEISAEDRSVMNVVNDIQEPGQELVHCHKMKCYVVGTGEPLDLDPKPDGYLLVWPLNERP